MGLQVTDIVARALAYLNKTTADSLPTGATVWLVDAIQGALGEMRDAAPGLFRKRTGGVLLADQTQTITVTAQSASITLASTVGNKNTIRIAGGQSDYRLNSVSGTSATIVPSFEGSSGTPSATIWNDAWAINDGAAFSDCEVFNVRINGVPLEPVESQEAAERRYGILQSWGNNTPTKRCECDNGELPQYWWPERSGAATYVIVYPMPIALVNIEAELNVGWSDMAAGSVVASTETYSLPADIAREVWRPLAIERWLACPLFQNAAVQPEIVRQANLARARLATLVPKKPAAPCFGSEPMGPPFSR